jgi:DNA-binding transcriptional ArsR family regulator
MELGLPPGLVSLLGRIRAECLRALAIPRSTSQLADCLGVSVGTASKQATVLRDAQLVTSRRSGNAVIHSLTPLGTALLTGQLAD